MTWLSALRRSIPLLLLGIVCGCDPLGSTPLDEQKDPHYLTGKSRMNSMDWSGAVESFQDALKSNPQSALAHRELGLLYYEHQKDYAAAIYHFNRFLALRPKDEYADTIRQFVTNSKQELAREVSLLPVNQAAQRDLDRAARLEKENEALKRQVETLQAQLAFRAQTQPVATNRAVQPTPPGAGATNNPTGGRPAPNGPVKITPLPPSGPVQGTGSGTAAGPTAGSAGTQAQAGATQNRTHTVKSGETPAAIARQYGIKTEALMNANPGLDARRMRPGQVLKIPAR